MMLATLNFHVRIAAVAVVATALAMSLAGCGASGTASNQAGSSTPVAGGSLHVARNDAFEGFNLDQESVNATYQLSQAVIEPLIRTNEAGTGLAPGIASKWTYNPDNTQLTVALNPDVKFSNGQQLTSADVAFSVGLWTSGPNYGSTYGMIKSTTIIDAHTIVIELKNPDTTVPVLLSWANAGVVPKDFGGIAESDFWQKPVGAGPFTVVSWSTTGDVVLAKNKSYYRTGYPYLDKVISSFATDSNSVSLQLRSKELDLADEIGAVTASTMDPKLVKAQAVHLTPVLLMNSADKALRDLPLRQAIGYAIDYKSIVNSAFKGYGKLPNGALPTNSDHWAPPSQPYFSTDLGKAKSLLAQVNQVPTELTLNYRIDPSQSLMAQVIKANLKKLGIQVNLNGMDAGNQFAAMSGKSFQMSLWSYNAISSDVIDPVSYLAATDSMYTGHSSDGLWSDIAEYGATADSSKKKTVITRVQDELFKEAPFIALGRTSALEAQQEYVHGMHITPFSTYSLDTVWKSQ